MKRQLKHNVKNDSVILCCGSKRCPEVYKKTEDTIQIRDDDGFVVTLTKEQARLIPQAIDIIEEKDSD